jgi:hypothetical protein
LAIDCKVNETVARDKQAVARPPIICQFSPELRESVPGFGLCAPDYVYHQEEDLTATQLCF